MNYELTTNPSLNDAECLVIGLLQNESLPKFTQNLTQNQLDLVKKIAGKLSDEGETAWQTDLDGHCLLLIHCGQKENYSIQKLNQRLSDAVRALCTQRILNATIHFPLLESKDADWQLKHMILQSAANAYQFLAFKSQKNKPHVLNALAFHVPGASAATIEQAQGIAAGECLTRNLANLPANICTPTYLAEQARQLAKQYPKIQTKIIESNDMREFGMGALLAVAQGSDEAPKLIEMQYRAGGDAAPIVIVGKGITFDSGGISLKPAEGMNEMKYDMGGAASVFGVMKACAELKQPINLIGLVAAAENMPSGKAVKPGDIVTSMSGQTIEIVNTDAEGRLVLADALTYAERFNPQFVIDIATLTGAVIIALGHEYTGLMTTDEKLATLMEHAARDSTDKTWRLPLDEAYQDALDSPIADMVNANFDRAAGSITAGCFLARFTQKFRWAHLDIAGTAWNSGKKRNATGRPVRLLMALIEQARHES